MEMNRSSRFWVDKLEKKFETIVEDAFYVAWYHNQDMSLDFIGEPKKYRLLFEEHL